MLQRFDQEATTRRIVAALLVAVFGGLLLFGVWTRWFPWAAECNTTPSCHVLAGETLAAIENTRHFMEDGLRFWLLQRNRGQAGVGLAYIHNVNLGSFLVYGTTLLGADSLMPAVLVTILAFCGGLAYAYLLIARISRSPAFGLLFLLVFVLELYQNTVIGLNVLRAWHWLPLFGVAYHALLVFGAARPSRGAIGGLFGLSLVGFCLGYELYAFVVLTAVVVVLLFGEWRQPRAWALFAAAILAPVLVRQAQVIGGVGPRIWATDLYFAAVQKTPLLRNIFPLLSAEEIAAWYVTNGIFRGVPNSDPISVSLGRFIQTGRYEWWLTHVGWLTLLVTAVGLVLAPIWSLTARGRVPEARRWRARAVLAVALGQLLAFGVFGAHALHYFLVQHELPMLVAPGALAWAFVVSLLLDGLSVPRWRWTAAAALVVVLLERATVTIVNIVQMELAPRPEATRWGTFVWVEPGGLYGAAGTVILAVAGVLLAVAVVWLARAFLRHQLPVAKDARMPGRDTILSGRALAQQ